MVPVTVNGGVHRRKRRCGYCGPCGCARGRRSPAAGRQHAILSGTPSNAPKVSALLDEGKAYYDADGVQITEGLDASTLGKKRHHPRAERAQCPGYLQHFGRCEDA